jgi:hypothetical protein
LLFRRGEPRFYAFDLLWADEGLRYDHSRWPSQSSEFSGLNEENPMKQLLATLLLLVAVSSFGKEQPVIKNPAKLVGKKVNVHSIPLCQPGTDTADLAHAGKQSTVVSVKPNKMPAMSPAFTSRLTPEAQTARNSKLVLRLARRG